MRWQHSVARGVTDQWRRITNKAIGGPIAESPLDFMLSIAVLYRHPRRTGGPMGFAAHFGHREAAELLAPRSRDIHNIVFIGLKDRLAELFSVEPELVNLRSRSSRGLASRPRM